MIRPTPWFLPKRWNQDTERESLRDWLTYALCRVVGHRPRANESVGWVCARCGDTLPKGNIARQP